MRIEGKVDGKNRKGEGRCEKKLPQHCRERPLAFPPWRLSTDLNWFAIQQGTERRPFLTRTFIGKGRHTHRERSEIVTARGWRLRIEP